MKTDDLIALIATNVEKVDRRQARREIAATIAIGATVPLATILLLLGIRTDLTQTGPLVYLGLKLIFAVGIAVLASMYLLRLARPGGEDRVAVGWMALPFLAVVLLAGANLALAPATRWSTMVMGSQWIECLISIPIIAIVPFATVIWVMRRMAPTDLRRAGAVSGLVAGSLSAAGYALHCTDDTLPFVALWYGGTIALCALAGALLGPRLLRW